MPHYTQKYIQENKMRRSTIIKLLLTIILLTAFIALFCACGNTNSEETNDSTTYTLQYTDDAGTHTITVTDGEPYSIEELPTKDGYTFMGLYDAKTGGTQFVDETGASVSIFTDKKSIVLFAQFAPIEYTNLPNPKLPLMTVNTFGAVLPMQVLTIWKLTATK